MELSFKQFAASNAFQIKIYDYPKLKISEIFVGPLKS